jgi:hypothetical protein
VLELALESGTLTVAWLHAVRAAAAAGVHDLVLTGPRPDRHPASQALWECGTGLGMHVRFAPTPPTTAAGDHRARIRLASDTIPRLIIPDGIPVRDLHTLGPALPSAVDPQLLRALEDAAREGTGDGTGGFPSPSAPAALP